MPGSEERQEGTLPLVSVIIVHPHGKYLLRECPSSLKRFDYPLGRLELLVVDSGPTDKSEAGFRRGRSSGFSRALFPDRSFFKNRDAGEEFFGRKA